MSVILDTSHFEISPLNDAALENKRLVSVTRDTSHSPIGPCGLSAISFLFSNVGCIALRRFWARFWIRTQAALEVVWGMRRQRFRAALWAGGRIQYTHEFLLNDDKCAPFIGIYPCLNKRFGNLSASPLCGPSTHTLMPRHWWSKLWLSKYESGERTAMTNIFCNLKTTYCTTHNPKANRINTFACLFYSCSSWI